MDDGPLTNTPIDDGESQTKIIRLVIVIALLAGCCIASIAALAWFQPDPVCARKGCQKARGKVFRFEQRDCH